MAQNTSDAKARMLNICQKLSDKLDAAAIRLECERPMTIINISGAEHTLLVWALHELWDKIEKMDDTATQPQVTGK